MRHRFDDIATFIQVVETASISGAARRLNIAKSVVSKRITDLERALGVELLHRSTRKITPTDKGTVFYERARTILSELQEAAEQVSDRAGDLVGPLRIAAPMTFGTMYLGPLLFSFAKRHPRLELSIDLDDAVSDIVGRGYDLAIRIGHLRDSSMVARKLATSTRAVCCSPAYAKSVGLPRTVEDLASHICIGYANVSASLLWRFQPASPGGKIRSVVVKPRVIVNNGELMRDAAIDGLGLVILPTFIAAEPLRRGQLVKALPKDEPLPDTIHAVYPQSRHVPQKVRAVIDYLVERLGGVPPWERSVEEARPRRAADRKVVALG